MFANECAMFDQNMVTQTDLPETTHQTTYLDISSSSRQVSGGRDSSPNA